MIPSRPALYYPRIHFPNVEWLKATLLAFGRVRRIVPDGHPLDKDPPAVAVLSERHGAVDPLVIEVSPDWEEIEFAQGRLLDALNGIEEADLVARFGEQATAARETKVGRYEIHRDKFHLGLFARIAELGLVWPARDRTDPDVPFLCVHPDLGEAVMGVSAIATARRTGSDVVTSERTLHTALAAVDEGALLRSFTGSRAVATEEVAPERAVSQLAHVVMATRFDLSQVSLEDVAALARDGVDLRGFRAHLLKFASRIPPELDQRARDELVQELADEVVSEWKSFEHGLPARLKSSFKQAIGESAKELAVETTKDAVKGGILLGLSGLLGSVTAPVVVAAIAVAGVPIVFKLVSTGLQTRRDQNEQGPTRFLSRVHEAGAAVLATPSTYRLPAAVVAGE